MSERILIEIAVDLDAMPGAFHTEDNARMHVQAILLGRLPQHNPVVLDKA